MSFKLTHKLPQKVLVAVSGGVDSMSVLHWLSRKPERVVAAVHVHHGTGDFAERAFRQVSEYCEKLDIDLLTRAIKKTTPEKGKSLEEHWRGQRYEELWAVSSLHNDLPIVIAHNADDCLENYITSTMISGHLGTIPYRYGPCIRPFRMWQKRDIERYARENKVPWVHDPTNDDYTKYRRAKIRRLVVPRIRNLNPGIYKVVERAIIAQDERGNGKNT